MFEIPVLSPTHCERARGVVEFPGKRSAIYLAVPHTFTFKVLLVGVVALDLYCYQYQHSTVCVPFSLKSILLLLVRRLLAKSENREPDITVHE